MKSPAFWWRPSGLLANLLRPFGWAYGAVTARRMARAGVEVAVPVICVGNFTMGGAGKTPTALHLAQTALAEGRHPVFLSRGYGGRLKGPIEVDRARHGPADCGDEPLLLARVAPCVIASDRPAGARLAKSLGADIIIMDDGMQTPSLRKTRVLAVVDGTVGIGNGLTFPAGPLRVPMSTQLAGVDAVLVLGAGEAGDAVARAAAGQDIAVVRAVLALREADIAGLRNKPLLGFAGIGRPEKFAETLRSAGLDLRAFRAFPDHYVYAPSDIEALNRDAIQHGLTLVTTAKDAVKLPRQGIAVSVVEVTLAGDAAFATTMAELISARTPMRP